MIAGSRFFRPERLVIPEDIAKDVKMVDLKIGLEGMKPCESQILGSSWTKVPPQADLPPTTTKENIEQAQFWTQIGWASIAEPENRNMDLVSARFDKYLERGCPECKAVWTELVAIGFTSQRTDAGEAKWNGHYFDVSTKPIHHLDDRAVRVQCFSGHTFDFDSFSGRSRKYELPNWAMMAMIGLGAIAIYGYLRTTKKL